MAGLIQSTLTGEKAMPAANNIAIAGSTTFDPERRTVDAGKETVAGQLSSILSSGSPYLTQARTGATQTANARGLINTSMAAGAGEDAAIRSALPIATSDANTYSSAAGKNQDAANTALLQGAQAENAADLSNAAAGNEAGMQRTRGTQAMELEGASAGHASALQALRGTQAMELQGSAAEQERALQTLRGEQAMGLEGVKGAQDTALQTLRGEQAAALEMSSAEHASALQNLRGEQATELANIEANYKNLIQSSASGSKLYSDAVNSITLVLANPDTTDAQKQVAVEKITQMLQSGLSVVGSMGNVDLSGLIDFTDVNSGINTAPTAPGTPAAATPPAGFESWDAWLLSRMPNANVPSNTRPEDEPGYAIG